MTTLLFELVRVLSIAAARELRQRAEGPALSRAEILALATLNDLAAGAIVAGEIPVIVDDGSGWRRLREDAEHDIRVVAAAKSFRPLATP